MLLSIISIIILMDWYTSQIQALFKDTPAVYPCKILRSAPYSIVMQCCYSYWCQTLSFCPRNAKVGLQLCFSHSVILRGGFQGEWFPISVLIISKYPLDICRNKDVRVRQYSNFRNPPKYIPFFRILGPPLFSVVHMITTI